MTSVRIDAGLWALAAAAAVFAAVLVANVLFAGGDIYWHIAAGRWMIENHQVLRIDPFSFTFGGQPWQTRQWLAEVLLALGYVGGGWSGVLGLCAVAAAAAAGIVAFQLARGLGGIAALVWFAAMTAASAGALTAAPSLLALPCLAAWGAGLVGARAANRTPPLALLAVMTVWANLDDGFVVGLALVLVLGVEAIWQADRSRRLATLRAWAVYGGLALIFALLTPSGPVGLIHAVRAVAATADGPVVSAVPVVMFLPAAAVLLPMAAFQRQPHHLLRLAFLAVLFGLALHSPALRLALGVAVPLLLAERLADVARPLSRPRAALALVLLVVAGLGVRLLVPVMRVDDMATPAAALANVPVPLTRQPVLNDAAFGGYLIFSGVKPFIDSRPLYSARFRRQYAERGDPVLLAKLLARYHIAWTILSPADPAVKTLDGLTGWTRLYTDQWAVVHVRRGAR